MSENLTNPSNALYIDSSTEQAVAVSTDNPMPCTNTINATIGDWAVATAANPSLGEGDPAPGSLDLTGQMRVTDAAVLAILGSAGDAAGDNTIMGQLKQIALNTTPV